MSPATDRLDQKQKAPPAPSLAVRLWRLPLGAHVAVLGLVLLLGLLVAGPRVAYSSDEGAAILQAHLLREGHGWLYRYPLASLDPEDQARPFIRGDAGTKGVAPYAKHPLYPLVLAGLDTVGGQVAILVGGALGTCSRPGWPRWLSGPSTLAWIGSPCGWWVWGARSSSTRPSCWPTPWRPRRWPPAWCSPWARSPRAGLACRRGALLGAMFVAWVVASMLRTEALFIGPAFAVGTVVLAGMRRLPPRRR